MYPRHSQAFCKLMTTSERWRPISSGLLYFIPCVTSFLFPPYLVCEQTNQSPARTPTSRDFAPLLRPICRTSGVSSVTSYVKKTNWINKFGPWTLMISCYLFWQKPTHNLWMTEQESSLHCDCWKKTWMPEMYASTEFWCPLQKYTLWKIKFTLPHVQQFYWRRAIILG